MAIYLAVYFAMMFSIYLIATIISWSVIRDKVDKASVCIITSGFFGFMLVLIGTEHLLANILLGIPSIVLAVIGLIQYSKGYYKRVETQAAEKAKKLSDDE